MEMMMSGPYSLLQLFLNMSVVGERVQDLSPSRPFDQLSQATITQAAQDTSSKVVFSRTFSRNLLHRFANARANPRLF